MSISLLSELRLVCQTVCLSLAHTIPWSSHTRLDRDFRGNTVARPTMAQYGCLLLYKSLSHTMVMWWVLLMRS